MKAGILAVAAIGTAALLAFSLSLQSAWESNSFTWQTASAESRGLSTPKLEALKTSLAGRGTKAFLVVRHDRIVYEWYAPGYHAQARHYTASLAKSLVGGLSLLVALNDGRVSLDDPVWKYIPSWREYPLKSKITIRQLATHSSGLENAFDSDAQKSGLPQEKFPGWKGQFWKRRSSADAFVIARDRTPVIFTSGSASHYSNTGYAVLAYAVTASLKGGSPTDIRTLLKERIMDPIGVPEGEWVVGYGKTNELQELPLVANWGGGEYTARAVARVGRLMLHKGNWDGRQLIDPAWVDKAVSYAGTPLPDRPPGNPQPGSGLGWWTNFDGVWPSVPRDAFAGAGAGNQLLLVIPSLDLIVVRNGEMLGDESRGEAFWGGLEKYLFNPLMDAVPGAPYPPGEALRGVTFAPVSSVVRTIRPLN